MNFKISLAEYINKKIVDLLAMQNPDGTFGNYLLSNAQYPFHTMAFALKKLPASPWHNSEQLKSATIKALKYFYSIIDDEGKTEFYGHSGSKWGKYIPGGWRMFCWQETLKLLGDDLPEDLFFNHKKKILEILNIHYVEMQKQMAADPEPFKKHAHNLLIWKALMLYRAGILWQNSEWEKLGADILDKAVKAQQGDGWWSEGGPIVGYNLVTALAISLYAEWSREPMAMKATEKAAHYHEIFSYPDGFPVETIDGRQRFSHSHIIPSLFIPPSFSRFPKGQVYLKQVLSNINQAHIFDIGAIHGFSFLSFTYENLAENVAEDITADKPVQILPALKSAVIKSEGWYSALCGYENQPHAGGFHLERQNLLSVWHEKTGLIIGGGHSNYQPEFSNFNVFDHRGILHYLHSNPKIQAQENEMKLTMTYGGLSAYILVRAEDARHITIRYGIESFAEEVFAAYAVRTNLILAVCPGSIITTGENRVELNEKSILWTEEDFGNGIEHNHWKLLIPQRKIESAMIKWPFYPYNSYRQDRKSELASAALIVTAQLFPDEPFIEYRIEILP
ncbi:MAG: hypothetical protein PHV82_03000 [Victivallaceae bacterium]|nr:hypothetical protein [Victivallaceae bacterium]